jgi:hypothetical protein
VALDAVSGVVAVGDVDVGDRDVATAGRWGTSWGATVGEQGCVGGLLDCRCSCVGGFVEYTTRSEERVRTTSRNGVSLVAHHCCGLSGAWVVASEVAVAVWVLVVAQVVVFRPFASGVVAVVDGDVAVAVGGPGSETSGHRVCRGAVGRLGRVCHRFRGAGSRFEAVDGVLVVVDDEVVVVDGADGGCADVVNGNVAALGGTGGGEAGRSGVFWGELGV